MAAATGAAAEPHVDFSPGDPEEIFEILEPLGEGAYGSVYKAMDKRDGEMVALKIMPLIVEAGSLEKEVAIMTKCASPYIVNFKGAWKLGDNIWLAMEYCGAGSITDLMKVTKKCLTEKQLRVVCRETLKGLDYLHSVKLIHRDIKAGNILVDDSGRCKLADFGVSREASTFAKATTVIGTPYWMAPEVFQEGAYNEKADIWSLGITLIEMATGRPPHAEKAPLEAIFDIPVKPPPTLEVGKWSDECHDFLAQCVVKDPGLRPSAVELLAHGWITGAHKGLKPIVEMVVKALPLLEEARREARLTEMADDDSGSSGDGLDSGTIIGGGAMRPFGVSDDEEQEAGVESEEEEEEEDDVQSGTMLIEKGKDDGKSGFPSLVDDSEDEDHGGGITMIRDKERRCVWIWIDVI